ncbi:MAG: 4a-hydroxytetrahydrobiopterin dehydratase [Chloroflexales bacterium]|nr:4a-hydroxytetrahydrobiopterin dehydratase [Chloroflexales bacterium]
MSKLTDAEITGFLEGLIGWSRQGDQIRKTYKLATFPAALAFVMHVGFLAEAAGHHPDIDIRYNKVTLGLTTHDAGGLTAKDFDLAAAADEVMG